MTFYITTVLVLGVILVRKGQCAVPILDDRIVNIDGDLKIGLIGSPASACKTKCRCPVTSLQPLVQMVLAKMTVDDINEDDDILPGLKLGLKIASHCDETSAAALQSARLLPISSGLTTWDSVASVAAITRSAHAMAMVPLFTDYEIPFVGFSQTSDELRDRAMYPNFFRTVPPDRYQTACMIEVMKAFQWEYFHIIYSGPYGRNAAIWLGRYAKENDICVAKQVEVPHYITPEIMQNELLYEINRIEASNARVIVLFISPENLAILIKNFKDPHHYVFILGEILQDHLKFQHLGFADDILGSLLVDFRIPTHKFFERVLNKTAAITLRNTKWNPFLEEAWEFAFQCSLKRNDSCPMDVAMGDSPKFAGLTVDTYTRAEYDAIYYMAYGLDAFFKEQCPHVLSLNKTNNNTGIQNCIRDGHIASSFYGVKYKGLQGWTSLNDFGEPPAAYSVYQYQETNKIKGFRIIGSWYTEDNLTKIMLDKNKVNLSYFTKRGNSDVVRSYCSEDCKVGQFYVLQDPKCCFECYDCRINEIVVDNNTRCEACQSHYWPDEDRLSCSKIRPTYLQFNDPIAVIILATSLVFLLMIITTQFVFIRNWNHRFIKACSRRVCCIIFAGNFTGVVSTILVLLPPKNLTCVVQFVMFAIGSTLSLGALFIKTMRVHRIFDAAEKLQKQLILASDRAQMTFIIVLTLVQVILCGIGVVIERPTAVVRQTADHINYVELSCDINSVIFLISLSYNIILSLLAAYYGFKTRKIPDNYNESWYIFLITCMTSFLWIAFVPSYFVTTKAINKTILLAMLLLFSFLLIHCCLFVPKLYGLYFADIETLHVNAYGATTATVVRTTVAPPETNIEKSSTNAVHSIEEIE